MMNIAKKVKSFLGVGNEAIEARLASLETLLLLTRNEMLYRPRASYQVDENTYLTKLESGRKIYVDRRDISLTPHLILEGYWERWVTNWLISNLKPADVFVDIGANVGYFSILAASMINTSAGGAVIAVEPNPVLAGLINKSFQVNGFSSSVRVENIALADSDSEMMLSFGDSNHMGGGTLLGNKTTENSVKVKVTTLDKLCELKNISRIDVIKMDVEGFEDKAFAGMESVIKQNKSIKMVTEFSPTLYSKPVLYFEKILATFKSVCILQTDGRLSPISSYEELLSDSQSEHYDLVLTEVR